MAGGRPTKLTGDVADRLVDVLAAGATLHDAAAIVGISPRTLRAWRRRAWSRAPEDAPFVKLERRVRALGRARHAPIEPAVEEPWQVVAARLALSNPAAWGTPTDLLDLDFDLDVDVDALFG
jgi:Homeodomain-like domain